MKVETDKIITKVKAEVQPAVLTSVITKEFVEDLNVKVGDKIRLMVKSVSMIMEKNKLLLVWIMLSLPPVLIMLPDFSSSLVGQQPP